MKVVLKILADYPTKLFTFQINTTLDLKSFQALSFLLPKLNTVLEFLKKNIINMIFARLTKA